MTGDNSFIFNFKFMGRSNEQGFGFLLKLCLIVFIIVVCDQGTGMIFKHFYFRQGSGVGYLTTYSIDNTTADILVFGSSRANHSYVPEIFEENLHSTFYNAGRDGTYILHNYAILKSVLRRYSPKIVIFDIRPEDIEYIVKEYEALSLLLPYYNISEIKPVIDMKSPFERFKSVSASYAYNSLIFQIAMGNLGSGKDRVSVSKGYVPIFKKLEDRSIDTSRISPCNADKNKINALNDIILTCRQKNIDLYFVNSPTWRIMKDNSLCYNEWAGFSSQNGINYYDMSNLPVFINNPQYFSDIYHLNDEGARIFSTLITSNILKEK